MNQNGVGSSPATVSMSIPFAEFAVRFIVDSVDGGAWFTIRVILKHKLEMIESASSAIDCIDEVISGTLNIQLFVNGLQSNTETYHGVTLPQISLEGCTFEIACNYDPSALVMMDHVFI